MRLAVTGCVAGEAIQQYLRDHWNGVLAGPGVEVVNYARMYGADRDSVFLQRTATGEAIVVNGVDSLVLAQGNRPDTRLQIELAGWGGLVYRAGDCMAPRSAEEAVLEA